MNNLMPMENLMALVQSVAQSSANMLASIGILSSKVDESRKEIGKLDTKVDEFLRSATLNSYERKRVREEVNAKVTDICKEYGWDRKTDRRMVYPTVWNVIYQAYEVAEYADIPRSDYRDALEKIRNFKLSGAQAERILEKLLED